MRQGRHAEAKEAGLEAYSEGEGRQGRMPYRQLAGRAAVGVGQLPARSPQSPRSHVASNELERRVPNNARIELERRLPNAALIELEQRSSRRVGEEPTPSRKAAVMRSPAAESVRERLHGRGGDKGEQQDRTAECGERSSGPDERGQSVDGLREFFEQDRRGGERAGAGVRPPARGGGGEEQSVESSSSTALSRASQEEDGSAAWIRTEQYLRDIRSATEAVVPHGTAQGPTHCLNILVVGDPGPSAGCPPLCNAKRRSVSLSFMCLC